MKSEKEKLTIKNWAEDDRPREKLIAKGSAALSDAELLAIIIGSGNKTDTAVDLAKKILLAADNSFYKLGQMSLKQLQSRKGIGPARAVSIAAVLEIARRRSEAEPENRQVIRGSNDVVAVFEPLVSDIAHEEFWVLFLNTANRILTKSRFSSGGMNATIVDVRMIMKAALEHSATALIICHNHPSGVVNPSEEDKKLTVKIFEAGKLLDIKLLDHIIIAGKKSYSFTDEGIL
jgi:DNA repair protein RadC